jgi:predicted metal-binding membrane protein
MNSSSKMSTSGPVERLVRHDQYIVLVCVALIVMASVSYTVMGVGMSMSAFDMTRMASTIDQPMLMDGGLNWAPSYAALIFLMWWVMMIAMMTPSAAPVLLLYTAIKRMGPNAASTTSLSLLFLLGYLIVWGAFSAVAAVAQFVLDSSGLSSDGMMKIGSSTLSGLVFLAAGLYQLSSLKLACLKHCRSPAHFLAEHNRPGRCGALITGMDHGMYCFGCCWALMALLFVGGVMNLYWIAGLAIYVAAEKFLPNARWVVPLTGGGLIAVGLYLVLDSALVSS